VELAMKHDQLVLIHTPHLSDKAHGTKTVLEVLAGMDVNPDKYGSIMLRNKRSNGYWMPGTGRV
jgi:predicted metal-dependent TIM-barrel fold hydrolase